MYLHDKGRKYWDHHLKEPHLPYKNADRMFAGIYILNYL